MRRSIVVLLSMLALSGCATAIDNQYQIVTVETPGVIGADCSLSIPGAQYRVITPATVQIERDENDLQIQCEKGLYPAKMTVHSKLKTGHAAVNVVNGLLPGLAYDIASGAIHEYPHTITVPMQVNPYAVLAAKDTGDELPPPPEKKAIVVPIEAAAPALLPAEKTMSHALQK